MNTISLQKMECFFGSILDVVTKTLNFLSTKPTCCVSCNQDPILVLDSQDWSACNIRSPTSPPGFFSFQFCDTENLAKFYKILGNLVEFTLRKKVPKISQFFGGKPTKFVKRKRLLTTHSIYLQRILSFQSMYKKC